MADSPTPVTAFTEIAPEFLDRVRRVVWCNVATLDRQDRPRSRILHPLWEVNDAGAIGWIITRRDTLKAKHLAHRPYVSLAYIAEIAKPVYADCVATWEEDPAQMARVWELYRTAPPPLGHDFGPVFGTPTNPALGLLRLTPWRVEVRELPGAWYVWRRENT